WSSDVCSSDLGAGKDKPIYVTVAGPTSVMNARVIDQCAGLYALWKNLYLNFVISDSADRLALVRSGQAAIAIVPAEQVPNEMDSKRIKPDKYILVDRKSTRLNSSHVAISYAVFCLKKKIKQ